MVMTEFGLELARVSMVGEDCGIILDLLVRPENAIVDYLTKHSGITADLLREVSTTFRQAQKTVADLIGQDTILVGHSLENDLHALKLVHNKVVDTSEIYPHPRGPPSKLSLSMLVLKALKEKMNREDGHDSVDDARFTMRLAQKKLLRGSSYHPCADIITKVNISDLIPNVHLPGNLEAATASKLVIDYDQSFTTECEGVDERILSLDMRLSALASQMVESEILMVLSCCGKSNKYFQLVDLKNKCNDPCKSRELDRLCQLAKYEALDTFAIISTRQDNSFT
jgi:DNA polymerase III epsilon subunit-like protein